MTWSQFVRSPLTLANVPFLRMPRPKIRPHRPDRRGAALVVCGLLYLFLGYGYTGSRLTVGVNDALVTAEKIMPLWGWGLVWVFAGLCCIASAVLVDAGPGAFGFIAAELPPLGWGTWYLLGWVGTHGGWAAHLFGEGSTRGWVSAGLFWVLALFSYIVAGLIAPLPEPSPTAATVQRLRRLWVRR